MLVDNNDAYVEMINRLKGSKKVALDFETSGLDWRVHHIVGYVLTFGPAANDTYYMPVRHAIGKNIRADIQAPDIATGWHRTTHPQEDSVIMCLNSTEKIIIGHNLSFDLSFGSQVGLKTNAQFRDTMIEAFIVDELRKSLSLEGCCRDEVVAAKKGQDLYEYLAGQYDEKKASNKMMKHFWRTDPAEPIVHDYAAGDGTSTWQLHHALMMKIIKEDELGYTLLQVHDIESRLIPVLHRMRMKGVKIDEEAMDSAAKITAKKLEIAQEKIGDINVRSGIQMQKLFEAHNISGWPETEKGNPSFPEKWLQTTELGQSVIDVRKSRNLLDSFLIPVKERHLFHGRVHSEFFQTRGEKFGTKTGRLSSGGPNLTAIPGKRQGPRGKFFREIFVPDTGKGWVEADYATCEIRIAAHYSKAKVWVEGFEQGIDPHTSVSTELNIKRQHAKTINLALMTGAGTRKIAEELGLPAEEGIEIVDKYFNGLPELRKFQREATNVFAKRRYIRTLLGRKLRLDEARFAYKAVNRLTQGGNADILKVGLVMADQYIRQHGKGEIDLLFSVHDSYSWQTDNPDHNEFLVEILCNTNGLIKMDVPLTMDVGYGKNWGEATFYDM